MLRGIDISNWQKTLDLQKLEPVDFVICKATEGTHFVDPYCDRWVQWCIGNKRLFGFYHYMNARDALEQADYFVNNSRDYFNLGVPVLDIEDSRIPTDEWGTYAQRFVDRVHAVTGVYPIIYASAAYLGRFRGTTVPDTCGLWVAGYPLPIATTWTSRDMPYATGPWEFAALWQFTASGKLKGFPEMLDLDYAYMDADAWMRYANPNHEVEDTTTLPALSMPDGSRVYNFSNKLFDLTLRLK